MPHLFRVTPILLLLAACMVGTRAQNYQPAKGPAGATINLELTDRQKLSGELLAVEDTSLLVLRGKELVRVALPRIRRASAPRVGFRTRMNDRIREQLRLISRYPQGVTPELEARLLQAYNQAAVVSVS
jgi:hypothetical protein